MLAPQYLREEEEEGEAGKERTTAENIRYRPSCVLRVVGTERGVKTTVTNCNGICVIVALHLAPSERENEANYPQPQVRNWNKQVTKKDRELPAGLPPLGREKDFKHTRLTSQTRQNSMK